MAKAKPVDNNVYKLEGTKLKYKKGGSGNFVDYDGTDTVINDRKGNKTYIYDSENKSWSEINADNLYISEKPQPPSTQIGKQADKNN